MQLLTNAAIIAIALLLTIAPCVQIVNADNVFLEQLWEERFKLNATSLLDYHEFEEMLGLLRLGAKQTTACSAAATATDDHTDHSGHSRRRRRRRSTGHSEEFEKVEACLNGSSIATILNMSESSGVTQAQFATLSVAVVQQLIGKFCEPPVANITNFGDNSGLTYLYGSISVLIISLFSTIGCLLGICYNRTYFDRLILFLIELAVGALLGESLLHLLPTVVIGSHSHDDKQIPPEFYRLLALCLAFFLLHLIDTMPMGIGGHSHNNNPDNNNANMNIVIDQQQKVNDDNNASSDEVKLKIVNPKVKLTSVITHPKLWLKDPFKVCLIIIIGDALHNFADGMAIGAAYVISHNDGLRLSVSVGLHELAHELADFAILISCGFSIPAAALMNFISSLTAFIGLYIAIPLAQASDQIKVWILVFAAIIFLYIAMVSMSKLTATEYSKRKTSLFLIGNAGLLTGILLVALIAIFEYLF